MPVEITTAYHKIKLLDKKIKIIQGGQGAGKTYSICEILLEKSISNPRELSTITTDTYPRLEDGVLTDMRNIFNDSGLNFNQLYNGQKKNLYFPNGSIIQFRNVDKYNIDAGKGPRRNNLFINEGNRVGWLNIDQAWNRTIDNIYVDFNGDREFWYHENIKTGEFDQNDTDFLILTYLDNECIKEGELKIILKKKARAEEIEEKKAAGIELSREENIALLWWKIYGLGELGILSDRRILSYDFYNELPDTARRIPSGMDFGVSPDPTVLIDMWIDGNKLYADEVFSMNNLLPETLAGAERLSISGKMDEVKHAKGQMIIADSAGATEIRDLRLHGYNIMAVKKQPGMIVPSLNKLRGYQLYISKRSTNLKKGIESYFWKVDGNGKIIPEPDGHEPDGIAAIRYVVMMKGRWWD